MINLVDEPIAEAMNLCAIDFPPEISEIEVAGLDLVPSQKIAPPRIAQAPVNLECRQYVTLQAARERYVVIGEVVVAHVRDGVIDPATLRVDRDVYAPIGRLFGGGYVRTHDRFEMPRLTYGEWLSRESGRADSPLRCGPVGCAEFAAGVFQRGPIAFERIGHPCELPRSVQFVGRIGR